MKDIDTLRSRIDAIGDEMLDLIAERQSLAREIGQRKLQAGLATRDYAQEKNVVEQAMRRAQAHGLSPELAKRLTLMLIEASLTAQERDRVSQGAGGSGRRVLVIGGAGKMGRWVARFLGSQRFEVEIADPAQPVAGSRQARDWRELTLDHDVVVVATPLRVTAEILEEMASGPPSGLVFDVGSLKSPLRRGLLTLAEAGAKVTSVHPMFGPDTELLSDRHVIFVDVGNAEATAEARALFSPTMAIQVEMDLESHDRLIAYVLGLSHATNIAFVTALAETGEAAPRLAQLSSTTFDEQLSVASKVIAENPHLYFEIQSLNDYGTEALTALLYSLERVRSIVRAGDEEAFVKLMESGNAYIAGTSASRRDVR